MQNTVKIFQRALPFQKISWRPIKKVHTSVYQKNKKDAHSEIQIPVPWGYVAGKWWGNLDAQPALALHGVQDNAATFDKLVPLLHTDAVLALDVPGHGLSSHIYPGFPYDFMDAVCLVRFVIKHHYKWEQPVVLIGHSFGSLLSYVYSAVYSDEVLKYISIDCARHQMCVWPNTNISAMRTTIEKTLEYEENPKPPEYTYDELLEKFYEGRKGLLPKESCEVLLSRGMSKLKSGKVCLSRDVRLKLEAFGRLTTERLLKFASMIRCDVLSIQAENGVVHENIKGELYKQTVDIVLKNNPKNKHVIMAGQHHLHLSNPEPVAEEINKFLSV